MRPSEPPEVSVVIPAYRAAAYVPAALDSVLAQTFTSREIILIDDGSPDSAELERAVLPYRERCVYLRQSNKGPSAARNTAIRAAKGKFIAFLDADDYWSPDYLSEQMKVFREDPSIDMVYADALIVGGSLAGKTFMQAAPSEGKADFEALLRAECAVILSGTIVKRDLVVAAGMFDERLRWSEDYDLWLRLASMGADIVYQRKVLLFRRELPTGLCADSVRLFRSQLRVLAKVARECDLSTGQRAIVEQQIRRVRATINLERGKAALHRSEFRKAANAIEQANTVLDSSKLRLVVLALRYSPRLLLRIDARRLTKEGGLPDGLRLLWRYLSGGHDHCQEGL